MTAPLLVFGWGNASRGDDALGPLFIDRLRERLAPHELARIDFLDDYQLQVEHALDLVGRERVLFVDASLNCAVPFEASPVQALRDRTFTTHAMSPAALLQVYVELRSDAPPTCTLLAIRGESFELGEPPREAALRNLDAALGWAQGWLR